MLFLTAVWFIPRSYSDDLRVRNSVKRLFSALRWGLDVSWTYPTPPCRLRWRHHHQWCQLCTAVNTRRPWCYVRPFYWTRTSEPAVTGCSPATAAAGPGVVRGGSQLTPLSMIARHKLARIRVFYRARGRWRVRARSDATIHNQCMPSRLITAAVSKTAAPAPGPARSIQLMSDWLGELEY